MKRWGDNPTPRAHRTIKVSHGEAFQLMLYREVDGPGEIWFWNSRDGVTPFCTWIDGKEYRHAMHGYPTDYTALLPQKATHVWVDYTRDAWREMTHRRWQSACDAPAGEWHDPDEFKDRWPIPESFEAVQPYEQGAPMQITREEFLETTTSWHGRVAEQAEAA